MEAAILLHTFREYVAPDGQISWPVEPGPMNVEQKHLEAARRALPGIPVHAAPDGETLAARGIYCDIVITWITGGGFFRDEAYCLNNPNLKWIHGLSAGAEGVTESPLAERPGLLVSSSKGIHGIPISEHIIGFMLCFARRLLEMHTEQLAGRWTYPEDRPQELYGKTLGILGLGQIGRVTAQYAKALGMRVIGVKRHVEPVAFVDEVLPEEKLDELLRQSDYVVSLLPFTEATYHTMNLKKFRLMKPTAFYISCGRGKTTDTDDLVTALKEKLIAGAALDALDPEPLPNGHPLMQMPNVLITPHISAQSPQYMDRAFDKFAENAACFLSGKPLVSPVDLQAKY